MTKRNRFGLSRKIPEPIRRQVRQSCRFGCIVCGSILIEYAHIDPPFEEAKDHDPDKIKLLCPPCHTKFDQGLFAKERIEKASRNPACKEKGYACEMFDVGYVEPVIAFNGQMIYACEIPIRVKGEPLFVLKGPEEEGGPFRLSANFSNSKGDVSLKIIDNEWRAYEANWDVEIVGSTITIRDEPEHISLRLTIQAPQTVIIERLDMRFKGFHFIGDVNQLIIEWPDGKRQKVTGLVAHSCQVGLDIDWVSSVPNGKGQGTRSLRLGSSR